MLTNFERCFRYKNTTTTTTENSRPMIGYKKVRAGGCGVGVCVRVFGLIFIFFQLVENR